MKWNNRHYWEAYCLLLSQDSGAEGKDSYRSSIKAPFSIKSHNPHPYLEEGLVYTVHSSMGEGGDSGETGALTHQVHSLDLPVCFFNG